MLARKSAFSPVFAMRLMQLNTSRRALARESHNANNRKTPVLMPSKKHRFVDLR
jgi:hypothetical protein